MICYHHNDLDGRCAAAIVRKKYPDCRMREINYNENPNFEEEVVLGEAVFIVDFSFDPDKAMELLKRTNNCNITWIDHHNTAKSYQYNEPFEGKRVVFGGSRDFSTPGMSGCELTWQYLFREESMPEAVRLLGDYDTWRFDTKRETMKFQFGMRSEHTDPTSVIWRYVFESRDSVEKVKETGKAILDYKDNVSRRILNNGYNINFEGHLCFVVNSPLIDSSMFDLHACGNEYGFFISWIFTGKDYLVSLRSRRDSVNVGEIAKKYGGGGHKGAAGFYCEKLPF
jgi:oligoribonuclease NrnB/cAMP/cGMP phosphodiesterase (DHH superfamily)